MKTELKTLINTTTRSNKFEIARSYFFHPLNEGLFGFAVFFVILIAIKFINNKLLGFTDTFSIEINDLLLSSLGFICFFLISFLNNFKKD